MERKIGEIFEHDGDWYQCLKSASCDGCAFSNSNCIDYPSFKCSVDDRTDNCSVIFKKLEKVGEPYMLEDKKFQKYKVFKTPYIYHKIDCSWQSFSDPYYISLEIKEDMEKNKLNLKPFDIQKAKEGKPVCTRDGRKVRIICFNRESIGFPIIALVKNGDTEGVYQFDDKGRSNIDDEERGYDLMMLPERKEGWVNVYYDNDTSSHRGCRFIYDTKEQALKEAGSAYITTVKIFWEE